MNATFTPSQTANTTCIRGAFDVCVAKKRANISDLNTRPTTWAIGLDGDYYFMEGLARELGIPVTWW